METFDLGSYLLGQNSKPNIGSYAYMGIGTEKLEDKSITVNLKDDTSFDSWEASTTQETILAASSEPDFEWDIDLSNFNYNIFIKTIVDVKYLDTATLENTIKRYGRFEAINVYGAANSITGFDNDSIERTYYTTGNMLSNFYYDSNGDVAYAITNAGVMYLASSFSVSSANGKVSLKRPAVSSKCNSDMFATDRKTEVDSENTNMIVYASCYKTPINNEKMHIEYEKMRNLLLGD